MGDMDSQYHKLVTLYHLGSATQKMLTQSE